MDKITKLKLRCRAYEVRIAQLEAQIKLLDHSEKTSKINKNNSTPKNQNETPVVNCVQETTYLNREFCKLKEENERKAVDVQHTRDKMKFENETKYSASLYPEEFQKWLYSRQEE